MLEDFRLKIFMTVAAERSFTKAAAALGISQPAVSQNISELERVMDMKLFDRLRGEVAITPQGKIFHQHVSRILSSYEDLNMIFCNPRINNRTTAVRLFISPVLSVLLLDGLRADLTVLRPDLTVELVDSAEAAHVAVLGSAEKNGSGVSIRIDVVSDDILLKKFFKGLVEGLL